MFRKMNFEEVYKWFLRNKNHYKNPEFKYVYDCICHPQRNVEETFYVVVKDDKIVHMTKVWLQHKSIWLDVLTNAHCISSTHPDYRQKGYATIALEEFVKDSIGTLIEMSSYTEFGYKTIKETINRFCELHKVDLNDGEINSNKTLINYSKF